MPSKSTVDAIESSELSQILNKGRIVLYHSMIVLIVWDVNNKYTVERNLGNDRHDHSTATWTKFYPILTPSPLEWTIVDILHNIYPLLKVS